MQDLSTGPPAPHAVPGSTLCQELRNIPNEQELFYFPCLQFPTQDGFLSVDGVGLAKIHPHQSIFTAA